MKNFSKKDFSRSKNNKNKKNFNSRNSFKNASANSDKNNLHSKTRSSQNAFKNNKNQSTKLTTNQSEDKNFSTKRDNYVNKSINNFSNRNSNEITRYQEINNKSFDDWIWGKHSVFAALNSERAINRIWCTSEILSSEKFYLLLKDLKTKGVLIEEVSWNRLSQLTYGATHQGIALQLASSKSIPLDKLINLSKKNTRNPIILALDGITDPHNLGAIIRSAEAFNCKGIVIPQRRSAGLTGTVAKVATGALEHIPVSRVVNLNRALEELKKNGFLTIGLSGDGKLPISNFNENSPLVVIIGAEDKGISLLTQKKCDFLVKIPLKGKTSSLNASVAAAITLFYLNSK